MGAGLCARAEQTLPSISKADLKPTNKSYRTDETYIKVNKYLNNVVEQDHLTVKKRVWLAKGYGSFARAWRMLQGKPST
jgi:transposase-like protein